MDRGVIKSCGGRAELRGVTHMDRGVIKSCGGSCRAKGVTHTWTAAGRGGLFTELWAVVQSGGLHTHG